MEQCLPTEQPASIVFELSGSNGSYQVIEESVGTPIFLRWLHISPSEPKVDDVVLIQACRCGSSLDGLFTPHPFKIPIWYERVMLLALLRYFNFAADCPVALFLGLGAGTIPSALARISSTVHIHAVEIDKVIGSIARKVFQLDERVGVDIGDGLDALKVGVTADAVILDAGVRGMPPESALPAVLAPSEGFLTAKAVRRLGQSVKPGGFALINLLVHSSTREPAKAAEEKEALAAPVRSLLLAEFPTVLQLSCRGDWSETCSGDLGDRENIILVAFKFKAGKQAEEWGKEQFEKKHVVLSCSTDAGDLSRLLKETVKTVDIRRYSREGK